MIKTLILKVKGGNETMNETAAVYVKVNASDKKLAESIMHSLGVTPSAVIQMLYKQVILKRAIPFDVSLPAKPIATGNMSEEEIAALIEEGIESEKDGTYTLEEVEEILKKI